MQPLSLARSAIRKDVMAKLSTLFSRVETVSSATKNFAKDMALVDLSSHVFEVVAWPPRTYACVTSLTIDFAMWEHQDLQQELDIRIGDVMQVFEDDMTLGNSVDNLVLKGVETSCDDANERSLGSATLQYELHHTIETAQLALRESDFASIEERRSQL